MNSADLSAIEGWIGDIAATLEPGARRQLASKISQSIRKANAERIAANIQPDGSAMAPRKPRGIRAKADAKKGGVKRSGKMFAKLKLTRNLRTRADEDGLEVGFFGGSVARVAAEHHYGRVGFVAKMKDGRTIRTRYTARRLIGFGADDPDMILDTIIKHIGG